MLNWLLVCIPVAVALEHFAPHRHSWIFIASGLAIVPLAAWMGHATEHLAERTGEGVGGFLNATFGNAAELIIALAALRSGLHEVVKASLAGSIIGNILLVLGAAMLAGGMKFSEQRFNALGARSQATMLTLAAIALMALGAYGFAAGTDARFDMHSVSIAIAVVLLVSYGLDLLFSLITHRRLFSGTSVGAESETQPWSVGKAAGILAGATVLIAWMSEILVGAIEPAAHAWGMNSVFVGVFVVAILGNAAEHSTAVLVAMKDRMDLALSIAIGSSVQVAVFVAPVLVFASLWIGPQPMDLAFKPGLVLAVFLSVLITGQVSGDGESNWIKGIQLLAVYVILGIVFFFLPQ
ncbi:MAG TPA: calcium/proton exchanger [Thermodesulfobacteriota bacterium]|nr:calcium/proton exchanger [Thermodesulfobacteriota bacterium]